MSPYPPLLLALCVLPLAAAAPGACEPGLLFYLSGDRGFTADCAAGGDPEPNFLKDVKIIPGGARGPGFQCAGTQLMSYWAPGNIYAERGTLAFYWRSRDPVGKTAFPVFRVGYADHSSWDMVWLRIDYNGQGGFDAFVTDAGLARIRVSYVLPAFPMPDQWVHLAFSWDETRGVRLYIDGALAAKKDAVAVLHAGLDQFGPHSRVIGPMQVQSAFNFIRGGDIDEIRIYDRMLSDANLAGLARGVAPKEIPALSRDLSRPEWRAEWWLRHGWNRAGDAPPYLRDRSTRIRKIEIHDVYDLKRWWWKATDGIRETTWPGVYNRSRLPGRNDYFQLPDWDCYSLSGKSVTFTMPDQAWNHIEISGAAWGAMYLVAGPETLLFNRTKNQEKTFHRLSSPVNGQKIRFENVEQETPIGELSAYHVAAGGEPQGVARLVYTLTADAEPYYGSLQPLLKFIAGRYALDERSLVMGLPAGTPRKPRKTQPASALPIVHIVIPCGFRDDSDFSYGWQNMNAGLDGIAIDLPALGVKPTHGEYLPLNLQVKDPIWPGRNMFDFSFSVKPGEARTLWLDTRDRILPGGQSPYLTIAAAGGGFGPSSLDGAQVRLVFKPRAEAAREHVLDRFTQLRDSYAMLVEEHTNTRRLNLFARFEGDVADLLRVDPDHFLARAYWYDANKEQPKPPFVQPSPPAGVPLWAFRQVENLRYLKRFVLWYIDHRQIPNGEFGGGLSDDGDLTNIWPGTAFMGCEPGKIKASLLREMEAFYAQGMFTNGLATIEADELHSYEEGINVLGQCLLLDYANPKHLERAMETSRALIGLTGVNAAGHRHIRSSFFSGTRIEEQEPWGWSKPSSYLIFHPALLLVEFNGNPTMKKLVLELAGGLLAHRKRDQRGNYGTRAAIRFQTDEDENVAPGRAWPVLWAAWRWTGDAKYLEPLRDEGPRMFEAINNNALDLLGLRKTWGRQAAASKHLAWQTTGDKRNLESLYAAQIEAAALREYINTEGSLWIDRVGVADGDLQRARLGGIALVRNSVYPGHAVSWEFRAPANAASVAVLIPDATPRALKIIVYNLEKVPVKAVMTAWDIEPGKWEIAQGVDTNDDDAADRDTLTRTVNLDRTGELELSFAPRAATVLTLKLLSQGKPYWDRPDLGIGQEDVVVRGNTVKVKVHSLGSVDAPATSLALLDRAGRTLASAPVPPIAAPLDLLPKTAEVTLTLPPGTQLPGASIVLDPQARMTEITRRNNRVGF